MEIGPIRNQNLIFWPLASVLGKIGEGHKKLSAPTDNQIYGLPANQFSPSAGTTLQMENLNGVTELSSLWSKNVGPMRNQNLIFWPLASVL